MISSKAVTMLRWRKMIKRSPLISLTKKEMTPFRGLDKLTSGWAETIKSSVTTRLNSPKT